MLTEDYLVDLEQFHGPMDLLLYLIKRAEVDVTAISLAQITDQYLRHLDRLDTVDVDEASEFLVTAATLVELKSRLVGPEPEGEDGADGALDAALQPGTDPAAQLIRHLLAYKRFRDAADALDARRRAWLSRTPTRPIAAPAGGFPDEGDGSDLEDVSLYDLAQAYARIAQTVQFDRLGAHSVVSDDTPIELHAADILDRLRRVAGERPGEMAFGDLFAGRSRLEVVGLFLATLELIRQRTVRVDRRDLGPGSGATVVIALRPSDTAGHTPGIVDWDGDELDDEPDDDEDELDGRHA